MRVARREGRKERVFHRAKGLAGRNNVYPRFGLAYSRGGGEESGGGDGTTAILFSGVIFYQHRQPSALTNPSTHSSPYFELRDSRAKKWNIAGYGGAGRPPLEQEDEEEMEEAKEWREASEYGAAGCGTKGQSRSRCFDNTARRKGGRGEEEAEEAEESSDAAGARGRKSGNGGKEEEV
uniref:Uncharacterized protein n=1 Tax=Vespula pensylvanica TaxID=30213 RepID=A0A834KD07_VESPE|nr:hypothetical protein H0235_014984 [Vespula pensylvanica]